MEGVTVAAEADAVEGLLAGDVIAGSEEIAGDIIATEIIGGDAAASALDTSIDFAEGAKLASAAGRSTGQPAAIEAAEIPAGSTAEAATSGSRITSSVRAKYFQDGAEPPTCSYCRQNAAEHLDHVIARVHGGDLSPENLTPACSWCNLSKGARTAPVNPPANYVGEWPPPFWPSRMLDWWNSTYGG